jgi:hypothetical protein
MKNKHVPGAFDQRGRLLFHLSGEKGSPRGNEDRPASEGGPYNPMVLQAKH